MARRLPAEWEPQDGILLGWPHDDTDWADTLARVVPVFLSIAKEICRYEQVIIPAPNPDKVRSALMEAGVPMDRITVFQTPTNDTWARDFGPITVFEDSTPVILDFGFNGWGLKFAACDDNQVTARIHSTGVFGGTVREIPGLILEGGSIESDGVGTLLTTSACLMEANRNPHLSRPELESLLMRHFGASHVLWLEHGYLVGDDTDSHIDTLARLAPDSTIIYQSCDDPKDEHFTELQAMAEELATFRNTNGFAYRLVALPWPDACYADDGHRLPATYANFLIINGAVLVPIYGLPQDKPALEAIESGFPDLEIVPVNCRQLIEQHGSLHCVTMQIPEGVLI